VFGTAVAATRIGTGESAAGMITGDIPIAFPAGIYQRRGAAASGSMIARLVTNPRRQAAVKRGDWLIAMVDG